jgi:folate-binding protein YgfZ
MTERTYVIFEQRGLVSVAGEDCCDFLQGLVSNDVTKAGPGRALYAAFLTPQGKYLHDFFIVHMGGALILDCERADDLMRRMKLYKLRSRVDIEDRTGTLTAAALFGEGTSEALGLDGEAGSATSFADGVAYMDPRLADAGARAVLDGDGAQAALEDAGFKPAAAADYDSLRLGLGLPDGSRDLTVEKSILLENGFDELNGIDWDKGCYMGQELTARTKHRALIRKRLMPVDIDGAAPAPGTPILLDGAESGVMRSAQGAVGLALMRLEHVEKARQSGDPFTAGEARLTPRKPGWASF